jgi:hypothetical protein
MPEQWIDDVVGDETRPSAGFEDQLARELHREWRGGRNPWRAVAWGVAAAVIVVGAVVVLTRDDEGRVVPADTTAPQTVEPSTPPSSAPDTTAPATTSQSTTAPSTTIDPSTSIGVPRYLTALAEGDYDTAAGLLNEGGLELEARADLRPLFRPEFGLVPGATNRAALAAALEKWCARALCLQPTEIVDLPDGRWTKAVFPIGLDGSTVSLFSDYVFEGQTGVTGLPLQLPPYAATADYQYDSIECPVDEVARVDWADVDGDGWIEQLVSQIVAEEGGESGVATYRVTTCGTATEVEPFEITGDGLAVYPVNPTGTGPDTLLIGFTEGYPNGTIWRVEGGRLAEVPGTSWGFGPPVTGYEQRSVGCDDLPGDGTIELVNYTFTEADGRLDFTATSALGAGASVDGRLPFDSPQADQIRIGMCDGLPVMTN